MKNVLTELVTVEDVKKIEKVSKNVSEKYVPIFTSDVIDIMEPDFVFVGGVKWHKNTTQHYIEMKRGNDFIRIYNSFDRTAAFRMFYKGEVSIDLGIDKLVHRGKKAASFKEILENSKDEIVEAIDRTKNGIVQLNQIQVTPELQNKISDVVFGKYLKKKGFQSYTNYVDSIVEEKGMSVLSYIKSTIANYNKGLYTVTIKGVKKEGREKKSLFTKLKIEGKVNKFLLSEYPELFL